MYGPLFASALQKVAFPVRGLLAAPFIAHGLGTGEGIEMASWGLVGNPFGDKDGVSDKSVRDNVIYRDGQYWSPKGTDVGDEVVMEHLRNNIPVSAMSSRMPDVEMNKYLDQNGALGDMERLQAGGQDSPRMLATLSPKQRQQLETERFSKLKRMTGRTITPQMVEGAQRRRASLQNQVS